jgi:hypothetical protein
MRGEKRLNIALNKNNFLSHVGTMSIIDTPGSASAKDDIVFDNQSVPPFLNELRKIDSIVPQMRTDLQARTMFND